MPYSTTQSNSILNWTFAKGSLTTKSAVYIGLCTNDPEADGGWDTSKELSGNGYARVLVSQSGSAFPNLMSAASDRQIQNSGQINWTKATAAWPTSNGFGLFETAAGGTPFYYGKLTEPLTVPEGAVALFDPATLILGFSDTDEAITT